jgi:hypothetical protein
MELLEGIGTVEETSAGSGNGHAGERASGPRRKRATRLIAASGAALFFAFLALQLVPAPPRTNPPVAREKTIHSRLQLPPKVSGILQRACVNCHSNETAWPWYSKVAPSSWLLATHVNGARRAMNLSEWPAEPAETIAALTAACADVEGGLMPPVSYRWIHPEARLSPAETKAFCAWTRTEVSAVLAGTRRNRSN